MQYSLPPIDNIGKDYLRDILANRKQLLKKSEVKEVEVPLFDELKVSTLYERYKFDPKMKLLLPSSFAKGRQINRTWFFNTLNSVYPEDVQHLL